MLFADLGSVHMVKNCDLGRENAPWSQFFTIRTSQPANNIYKIIYYYMYVSFFSCFVWIWLERGKIYPPTFSRIPARAPVGAKSYWRVWYVAGGMCFLLTIGCLQYPWPLGYQCSALPTELSSHLGAGRYCRGHGFESSLKFFQSSISQLHNVHNCDDQSFLHNDIFLCSSNVHVWCFISTTCILFVCILHHLIILCCV